MLVPVWDIKHRFVNSANQGMVPLEHLWLEPMRAGCDRILWNSHIPIGSLVAIAFVPTRTKDTQHSRAILRRYLHGVYILSHST